MNSEQWTPLHARLHQTLRQKQLLPKDARVLIAVSGGQDSLCLFKLLLDLQSLWGWYLAIAHCDHCWPSDQGMATHVQEIAQNWQVPFYIQQAETAIPEKEAEARTWRYQVLSTIALDNHFSHVVTGHTQSDRAETLLYNLIRGSGSDGLGSLTWVRSLTDSITLVRPLLNITREQTYQFCQKLQIPIWEDPINLELKFTRNRIRHHVIPYLKNHFNPQVETNLAQTAEIFKTETDYLCAISLQFLQQCITPNQDALNRLQLRSLHLAIQRRVIQQFLKTILPKSPNFEQIEEVVYLITAPNRSKTSSFPGNIYLEVHNELILSITNH